MKINVSHIAKLANLSLSKEETKQLENQLEETLTYVEKLHEVDTTGVEPTNNVTGLENVADEDVARSSLTQQQALANAKNQAKGLFKVKGIFDNE